MFSKLNALRVPLGRRPGIRLPSEVDESEKTPLIQAEETITATQDDHVPFDPIDPYHPNGPPKKKVLYGPDGYLGQSKDWKQSNFQKMTGKVESLGNRVVRDSSFSLLSLSLLSFFFSLFTLFSFAISI